MRAAPQRAKCIADDKKVAAGAGPDVVRLFVEIEDAADIIADLEQALAGVGGRSVR
jgi:O-acetylhomoserine (thiol)-lyase